MGTGWRTRAAVDSKCNGQWRLGLTAVLLWTRHWLYYISNYHQCQHLTMCVCEERACMTNHHRHQTVCIQGKHISSSLLLSSPSLQPTAHLGLIVQQQPVCTAATWSDRENHCRAKKKQQQKKLCSLQNVRNFRESAETARE